MTSDHDSCTTKTANLSLLPDQTSQTLTGMGMAHVRSDLSCSARWGCTVSGPYAILDIDFIHSFSGSVASNIQRTMSVCLRSGHADHLHPANYLIAEVVSMFGSPTAPIPSLVSNFNWTHKAVFTIRCPQVSPQEIAAYMHSDLGRLSP